MELMGTGELAFMEQFGGMYMYHACVRGNNKRSSDLIRHPPQAKDLDTSSSAVAASRPTLGVYHIKTAPFGPCASWIAPVLSTLWTNRSPSLLEVGVGLSLTCILGTTEPTR